MKQVSAYKTLGGKLFEDKTEAKKHESRQQYEAKFTKAMDGFWQLGIIEQFITLLRGRILTCLGSGPFNNRLRITKN